MNDERRSRENGADDNNRVQFTTLQQVYEDLRWDRYWRSLYPQEFEDAHRLAAAGVEAERAVRRYLRDRKGAA
jgi:hypothetical protein